ncbi:MAG: type IV toxin-antitoxin system AbiEi family antitoxin domain-containing protein [Firmicutes bacterium]|nr:type IV toxin-antitoxin system AbiEi family antitoxin domain-containing protein [Bacillota bacterium]
MDKYKTVKQIFKSRGNIATTGEILKEGIHSSYIADLIGTERIARIKRGVYEWVEDGRKDDLEIIFRLLPDAILCMDNALYYYQYTDRTPGIWHIAVDKRINRKKVKLEYPPIKAHFIEPQCLAIGLAHAEMNGIKVRIYDRERTICDVIRHSAKMDAETVGKAIQAYVKDGRKNISRLMEYARRFRIQRKVHDLMGVWL